MYNNKTAPQSINDSEALTNLIIDCIQDIKGKNIIRLDLREIDDSPTDFFIICDGDSTTQIRSIANNVRDRIKEEIGLSPSYIEGQDASKWVLVDYFDIVVHVFYPETREFYELEDLWSDAIVTEYQNI